MTRKITWRKENIKVLKIQLSYQLLGILEGKEPFPTQRKFWALGHCITYSLLPSNHKIKGSSRQTTRLTICLFSQKSMTILLGMEDSHRHMSFGHPILPFSQKPLPPYQRSVKSQGASVTSASSLDLSPRHLLVLLLTMGGTRCSVPSKEQPLHFYARFHLLLPM